VVHAVLRVSPIVDDFQLWQRSLVLELAPEPTDNLSRPQEVWSVVHALGRPQPAHLYLLQAVRTGDHRVARERHIRVQQPARNQQHHFGPQQQPPDTEQPLKRHYRNEPGLRVGGRQVWVIKVQQHQVDQVRHQSRAALGEHLLGRILRGGHELRRKHKFLPQAALEGSALHALGRAKTLLGQQQRPAQHQHWHSRRHCSQQALHPDQTHLQRRDQPLILLQRRHRRTGSQRTQSCFWKEGYQKHQKVGSI